MHSVLTQIITIYIAGITGLYKGVPVGFAFQASPVLIALFTALGSVTIVLAIFFAGDQLKNRIIERFGKKKMEKKSGLFTRIMEKYGLVGLGIIAPGFIGPIGAIIMGLIMIQNTKLFLVYLIAGIFLWSIALTTVGYYSIDLITGFL
jgi:membrane protein DedA with SNARE-associated domain